MITINSDILNAFKAEDRVIGVRCTFNDEYVVDGEYVKDLEITEMASGDTTLTLGNTCSSQLVLNMYVPDVFCGLGNAKIKVQLGVDVNGTIRYTNAGVFFVDSYKTNNDYKSVNIVAYDAMQTIAKMGNSYTCTLSGTNVTIMNVLKNILQQANISTSYIGSTTTTKSYHENRPVEGIIYANNGVRSESNTSIGITDLIYIPVGTSGRVISVDVYDTDATSIKLLFFYDPNGRDLHSVKDIRDVSPAYDLDDESESYVTGSTSIPTHTEPLYMAICSDVPEFTIVPDCHYEVSFTENIINYVNNNVTIPNPNTVDISPRMMLGYMAGAMGCNAMFNKDGNFVLKRLYNADYTVYLEQQYKNGFAMDSETLLSPTYITTGFEAEDTNNVISYGSGDFGFNFTNPYITTESMARNIKNMYNNISFVTGELSYRYCPALECGDIIIVEDRKGNMHSFLNMKQRIKLYGGLKGIISCEIDRDASVNFVTAPTTRTVSQRTSDFDFLYQSVISKLTGSSGGYVKFVYDSYNKMRAIAITTRDVDVKWDNDAGKVVVSNQQDSGTAMWVWCDSGLWHTNDGGSHYDVAMNSSGEIAAELIVGKLGAFVELQAELGTIGGWTITENAMYSDYTDTSGNTYRAYIQNASAAGANSWVFSVQKKNDNGTYGGGFIVKADGKAYANNSLYVDNGLTIDGSLRIERYINDMSGYQIFGTNNNYVFGYGAYAHNLPTYLEGNDIYLRMVAGNDVHIQNGASDIFTLGVMGWKFGSETSYVDRMTITGKGGFVLSANGGSNAMYLVASTIRLRADTYLNFSAASGTVALAVNTSGKITTTSSSKRYKENITETIPDKLNPDKLYDLPVVVYNYKDEYKDIELVAGTQIGITAEDVEKHYPNALIRNADGQPESWQDRIMIPAMLKLIQEQKTKIDSLEERLARLENFVNQLTKE